MSDQPAPDAGLRAALTAQELALLRESTDPQYRRLPMPERELVSRLLGGEDAGDGGLRRELDETKRQRDRAWQNLDIAHEDIAAMLRASGLGDHARPISTHDVIRGELLPWIEAHALRPAGRPDVNEPMVPCPWCGGEGYDNVYLDDEGVSRHTICRNDVRTETIERVLAALSSPETTPAGPDAAVNGGRCAAQAQTARHGWVQCVKPPFHEDSHVWGDDNQVTPSEPFA